MYRLLLVALVVAYPALVYFGLAHVPPSTFAILIAIFGLLRLRVVRESERSWVLLSAACLLAYAVAVVIWDSETLVRLYPAMVNAMMLGLFGWTLVNPPSIIERISRTRGMAISPAGIVYTRNLTAVWCVFFVLNGLAATYSAVAASRATWALYNGLLVYFVMGLMITIELLYRRRYQRRHGEAGVDS